MNKLHFTMIRRTPLDLCILIVGLCLMVSLWATSMPDKTIPQVEWVLLGIGLYYLTAWWSGFNEQRLVWAGRGIALIGLGLGVFGLVTARWEYTSLTLLPFGFLDRLPHLPGVQTSPNIIAGALALIIPLLIGLAQGSSLRESGSYDRLERLVYGLLGLILTVVVVLTKSRGGFLGVVVGLGLVWVLRWRWKAILVLGAIGLLAGLSFVIELQKQVGGTFFFQSILQNAILYNWQGRLDIWSRAVYIIEDFPLSGIGMGTFKETADTLYPFYLNSSGMVNHAHNLFLQVGLDLGLVGLAGWLGTLMCAVRAAWSRLDWPRQNGLAAGLLGSFSALAVHGLFDATTWGTRPALLVWVIWGLAAGLWRARGEHV